MQEVITVSTLGCYPPWRCVRALGWQSSMPVDIVCDLQGLRIIIVRSGQAWKLPEKPPR